MSFTPGEVPIDLALPHEYELRLNVQPVAGLVALNQRYFPEKFDEGDADYFQLAVKPAGAAEWNGVFYAGYEPGNVFSGIFSTAHPDCFLVVARGRAYHVNARRQAEFRVVQECLPVMWAQAHAPSGLVLLADFHHLIAIGKDGVTWQSARLTWDGLTIQQVTESKVLGLGWDAIKDIEVPFAVSLADGRHSGGAAPGV